MCGSGWTALVYDLSEETIQLEKNKKHTIEIVVDRLVIKPDIRARLADSIETASSLTGGIVIINVIDGEEHAPSPRTTPARSTASAWRS